MSANYEVKGNIAVITLNNPPVNGLGYATRLGIFEGLKKALSDASRQGGRDYRCRQGLLRRRRHQGIQHAQERDGAEPALGHRGHRGARRSR